MANALVVHKVQLPQSQKSSRAAQYVRMSTEKQRYSIENQAAVIATYAHAHGLTIVCTYADRGESGLRIKNRIGLTQLIDDVSTGKADFGSILVYDVSRWGRFQDVDESAHYEFVCRQAGVKVVYCAEQFDNDGSMVSSIVKNLKRVMAAEYSRELSVKIHAGACRVSRLGFKVGGRPGYALQRELVDERLRPKGILKNGERKYLTTDHIRLRPGSKDQVAVVRWIFQRFIQVKSETAIAAELNCRLITTSTGCAWNRIHVSRILRNENYVGNLLYNRRSKKLGGETVYNPPELWVRSEGCLDSIIDKDTFMETKKLIVERRVDLREEEMLVRLRQTLLKEGRLSPGIIDRTIGLPCTATFMHNFGTLRNAYRLVGYTSKRNCDYIDSRQTWAHKISDLMSQVVAAVEKVGGCVAYGDDCLSLKDVTNIAFRVARWVAPKKDCHSPHWSIQRRSSLPAGWIAAIRLDEHNGHVLDYLLLPPTGKVSRLVRFSENARIGRAIQRFATAKALIRAIGRVASANHVCSAKPVPSGRSKRRIGRRRH
jgi:DNA invertase Pin-like site-specific DNA recombinase